MNTLARRIALTLAGALALAIPATTPAQAIPVSAHGFCFMARSGHHFRVICVSSRSRSMPIPRPPVYVR